MSRTAAVWVRVDTIYGNDTTDIVMYWEEKTPADFSDGGQVFGRADGYMGVWHMNGTADASGQGHTLASQSDATTPVRDTGLIGGVMRSTEQAAIGPFRIQPRLMATTAFRFRYGRNGRARRCPATTAWCQTKSAWNDPAGLSCLTISG